MKPGKTKKNEKEGGPTAKTTRQKEILSTSPYTPSSMSGAVCGFHSPSTQDNSAQVPADSRGSPSAKKRSTTTKTKKGASSSLAEKTSRIGLSEAQVEDGLPLHADPGALNPVDSRKGADKISKKQPSGGSSVSSKTPSARKQHMPPRSLGSKSLKSGEKGNLATTTTMRKEIPSSSQYTPTSIGLSGAKVLIHSPSFKDDGAQTIVDSRKGDTTSDTKTPPGGSPMRSGSSGSSSSSVSSKARTSTSQPTTLNSLGSKSPKSGEQSRSTTKLTSQKETPSSSQYSPTSNALFGADFLLTSPSSKDDGAGTRPDSRKRDAGSDKKSPSGASSASRTARSPRLEPTLPHSLGSNSMKSEVKGSPTAKTKVKKEIPSSSQYTPTSIGVSGADVLIHSPSLKDGPQTLPKFRKEDGRSCKKSPGSGSSVSSSSSGNSASSGSSKARTSTSQPMPLHSLGSKSLKSGEKSSPTTRSTSKKKTPSSSQYTPISNALFGADFLLTSPSSEDDGARTHPDSRKGDDWSDKKSPSGGSSLSRRARSPRLDPTPPQSLGSKSGKSEVKGSPTAKTKVKKEIPSSSQYTTTSIGVSGADVLIHSPSLKDGPQTLPKFRKEDGRSGKKSPGSGSSVSSSSSGNCASSGSSKARTSTSQPTPLHSFGSKSLKSGEKSSPTTRSTSKKETPSSSQYTPTSNALFGGDFLRTSPSSKDDGAGSHPDSRKRDDRSDKKSPSGGSFVSRRAHSPKLAPTPAQSLGSKSMKSEVKGSMTAKTKVKKEIPSNSQYTPSSIGVSGADVLTHSPSLKDGPQTLAESRRADGRSDEKSPGGGSSVSSGSSENSASSGRSKARAAESQPMPALHSLGSKSLKSREKDGPTASTNVEKEIPSSSKYTPTSLGLSGAEVLIDSPSSKHDGARTLPESRKGDDRSDKKSPSAGSSGRSKVRSPTSQPTPQQSLSSKSPKTMEKRSPTMRPRSKKEIPSSSQYTLTSVGLSGAKVLIHSPSSNEDCAQTLVNSRKGDATSDTKSPAGGSPVISGSSGSSSFSGSSGSSVRHKARTSTSQPTTLNLQGSKSPKSGEKSIPTTRSTSKKETPSSSQYTPISNAFFGADFLLTSPSSKDDGARTRPDSRKGDDKSDKKSPSGDSSLSRKGRSPRLDPTPPQSLGSKSMKSGVKGSPTLNTNAKKEIPSSSQYTPTSIGLSGAEVLINSPLSKDDGAQALADSRKEDGKSGSRSPGGGSSWSNSSSGSRGSSVSSKERAPTSQPTPLHSPGSKSVKEANNSGSEGIRRGLENVLHAPYKRKKSAEKESTAAKTKSKGPRPSSTATETPRIGLSGAEVGSDSPSREDHGVETPTQFCKGDDTSNKQRPSGGYSASTKAPTASLQHTSPGSLGRKSVMSTTMVSPAVETKQQAQSPSQQQQPGYGQSKAAAVLDSWSPKTDDARTISGSGKQDDRKDKKSPRGSSVSTARTTESWPTTPMQPFSGELPKSKAKETSVESERKMSEASLSQHKQQNGEPFYAGWEFWKRRARGSQQKDALNSAKSRRQSSAKAEEITSSPKKASRAAHVIGSIGLTTSSLLYYPPGGRRKMIKPEDVLKLFGDDEPKAPAVKVVRDQPTPAKSSSSSESSFKEGLEKFAVHLSSELSNAFPGESQGSRGRAGKGPKTDKPVSSRQSSPASGSSKATSRSSTESRNLSVKNVAHDLAKDELDLQDLINAEVEEKVNIWKKMTGAQGRQMIIPVIIVALLLVAVYYRRLWGSPKPAAEQALMANFPDAMYHFCQSSSCKRAATEMKASVNISVAPCEDMYSFACGKWKEVANITEVLGVAVQLSYKQGLEETYLDRVEQQLLSPTQDRKASKIGAVYQSCVAFFTNRSAELTEMWPTAFINPNKWLNAKDHVTLFDLVVDNILTNHLSSIFLVVYHANATVDIATGVGISEKSMFTLRQYIMTAAINLPANDWFRAREADIKKFNDAVNEIFEQYEGIQNPLVSIPEWEFQRDPVAALFLGPIAKHLVKASKPPAQILRYPNDASVLQMAELFGKFDVKLAAVYLMHVPFADFVNFEKESSVLRGNYGYSKTRSVCSDYVHGLFNEAYHSVISTPTERSAFLDDINAIWKRIQEAGSGRPTAGGVRLKEDPISPNVTLSLHGCTTCVPQISVIACHAGTISDPHKVPQGALDGNYSDDFIVNLIIYTLHTGVKVNLELEDSWSLDTVQPKLLQPPFYFQDATEPYINYATLGVTIAQALFQQSVSQSVKDSSQLAACFATYGLSHMRVVFDGRDWPNYQGLTWSIEVALDAALGAGSRSAELERFMMVRFARTFCGEEPGARQPLTYVVKSSETFARAFGCAIPPFPYCSY